MRTECQVCFESYPKSLFLKITSNCNHKSNICKLCVNRHITAQLDSKRAFEITCPFDGCNQKFKSHDVKKISKELFERFDTAMLLQALSKMPEFRWCKNPRCNSGQIHHEGDDAPIVTCQACGQKSCYTHDIPWHKDTTCSNYYEVKRGNDEATRRLLEKETKQCPKCGVRIIKDDGCNHMTCKISTCGYEFCWLCFADFNKIRKYGNGAHKTTCAFYA